MQGFIRRQIPVSLRRLVTMLPAFVVIAIGVDPTRTLVISQVVLSFGIPFALVPLVVFTARRDVMGAAREPAARRPSPRRRSRRVIVVAERLSCSRPSASSERDHKTGAPGGGARSSGDDSAAVTGCTAYNP